MHITDTFVFSMFLIFAGAAILSTLSLFARQSLLVAYIFLGILLGPWGFHWIPDHYIIQEIGDVGIIFLLFLLGLHLHPQSLWQVFRKTLFVTMISSLLFGFLGYVIARLFHYTSIDGLIIGLAMMFSSTIICLKLLPEEILKHRHQGKIIIGILLIQDLIAIVTLLFISAMKENTFTFFHAVKLFSALPLLFIVAYVSQRFVLMKLINHFKRIKEYKFLLSIAWCLGMAEFAGWLGLSEGIGAFIAGVTIAMYPISEEIAQDLSPIRDFFLVLFFFAIGAQFDYHYLMIVLWPTLALVAAMLILKPLIFRVLLREISENKKTAWEVGWRLGQISEFSLMIAYIAMRLNVIDVSASYLIQAATIVSFIASSYVVCIAYQTPMTKLLSEVTGEGSGDGS